MLNVLRLRNLHQFLLEKSAARITQAALVKRNNITDFVNNAEFYDKLIKLNKKLKKNY